MLTRERLAKAGDKLLDGAILLFPQAVLNMLIPVAKGVTSQPWHVSFFAAPLGGIAWVLWRRVTREGSVQMRRSMLAFLICYLGVFTLASGSNLLVWKRESVVVSPKKMTRQWLAPAAWGDWRYWLAHSDAAPTDPIIITVPVPVSIDDGRNQVAQLVRLAVDQRARGIAFDFHFGDEVSNIDPLLCDVVRNADIPVITGVRLARGTVRREVFSELLPPSLEPCWPGESRGHLQAVYDGDRVIRNVVLRVGIQDSIALGLRVARIIAGKQDVAESALLQYVEQTPAIQPIAKNRLADLDDRELGGLIRGRFLLVGENSPRETFPTPYGDRLGVQIHAAAIANLVSGDWIRPTPWWSGVLAIFVGCYMIALMVTEGASQRKVLAAAAGVGALSIITAAAAMYFWRVWLDVVYTLVAVWLLSALLLVLRRRLTSSPVSTP